MDDMCSRLLLVRHEAEGRPPRYGAVEVPLEQPEGIQARIAIDVFLRRAGAHAPGGDLSVLDAESLLSLAPEECDEPMGHLGFYLGNMAPY